MGCFDFLEVMRCMCLYILKSVIRVGFGYLFFSNAIE